MSDPQTALINEFKVELRFVAFEKTVEMFGIMFTNTGERIVKGGIIPDWLTAYNLPPYRQLTRKDRRKK